MPINKIVIGPMRPGNLPLEVCTVKNHPQSVADTVKYWAASKEYTVTFATYNPLALQRLEYEFRHDGGCLDLVYLRKPDYREVKLTDMLNLQWLQSGGLVNLYMQGEFEQYL